MRVFKNIDQLPTFKNAVITIGSFDGIHRGHQQLISRINQLASEIGGESVMVTFHPHPRQVIFPKDKSISLLNTLEEKLSLCKQYGIDNVVVVPFSVDFSRQSPEEYIEKFIIESFQPKYIVIGYDHKFGLNRAGNIDFLKEYELSAGFKVIEIQKQELEDIAISSSKIRTAIKEGNMETAKSFLGHNYVMHGQVIHGDKIGQSIGYPTANIQLSSEHKLVPMDGVYAVRCQVIDRQLEGMMYIGRRPTLENKQSHKSIEVNLFDFDEDIYNDEMSIEVVAFVRGDEKFDSLDALKLQLKRDKIQSLKILASQTPKKYRQKDRVCIAILNYNGEEYLESFLPQVLYSSQSPINIAVIDNASTDGSVEYVKEWHPEIQLVELTKNYGFAGGYNKGLEHIDAEYIVLLNSDVLVTDNWLDPILELMDADRNIAACQPKILSLEHKSEFEYAGACGGFLDKLGYPYCRGRIFQDVESDKGQYDNNIDIDWASGAAMVIRASLYNSFGGLDKDFFAHMEEIDLCWRIRRAGYRLKVVSTSKVYHLGGGTLDYQNPRKVYLNFRNSLATLLINERGIKLLWAFPTRLLLDGVAGLKYLVEGRPKALLSIVKAHFATYGSIGHILRKRAYYNRLIRQQAVGPYTGSAGPVFSIIYAFYLKGKKQYSDL